MKCSVSKEVLEYAVSSAERFTGKNINLPVLGSLLLEVSKNTIGVTGTNLEYAFHTEVPAKVVSEGRVCIPARVLSQYIQSIGEEHIDLEAKGATLTLKTASRVSTINGTNPDDFPLIPKVKKIETGAIDAAALVEGLARVLPAVSLSEFKPELGGVYVKYARSECIVAATDTFRLAESRVKVARDSDVKEKAFILPAKVAQEIVRMFTSEGGEMRFTFGENQVEIKSADTTIVSRLIEGAFPEYSAIIPKTFSTSLYLPRQEFIQAVRSSSIFSSKLQDVNLQFSQKKVEVSSENTEVGLTRASIPVELAGKPLAIRFNHKFLLDGMGGIAEDEFFFGGNDANTPALIRNKSDASFTYVVMPIRLT